MGSHLVAIEGQEELESVGVKDLDGRVEERNGQEAAIGAVLDRENVIRHLERLGVGHREDARALLAVVALDLADFKVPELDVLVARAGDEAPTVGTDVHRPDGPSVRLKSLEERGRGEIVQKDLARLGPDDDLEERIGFSPSSIAIIMNNIRTCRSPGKKALQMA